jgi:hypothetical protein
LCITRFDYFDEFYRIRCLVDDSLHSQIESHSRHAQSFRNVGLTLFCNAFSTVQFKTTVAELQSVNPELSGGALIQPGVIVKLPPYDSSCDKPILVSISSSTPPGPTSQGEPNAQPQPVPVPRPPAVEVVVQAPPTNPPPVAPIVIPSPPPAPVPVPAPAPEPEAAGPAFEEDEAPLAPEAEEIQPAEPLTTPTSGTISTRVAVAAVVAAALAFVPL